MDKSGEIVTKNLLIIRNNFSKIGQNRQEIRKLHQILKTPLPKRAKQQK